jgi:hypothetical protein
MSDHTQSHRAAAEAAAEQISLWLTDHGATHYYDIVDNPPTIQLTLSVLAAHTIIDALRSHEG